jgi:hypothetical protein
MPSSQREVSRIAVTRNLREFERVPDLLIANWLD